MKLKVCGMKYLENIRQVAELQPDYLGFIFYKKSKRNFDGVIPELPKSIKKVGVFVNANIEEIISKINHYHLNIIQLHGNETVSYINKLKESFKINQKIEIIKVFSVDDFFNFEETIAYGKIVNYFLFDTKGKERGGSGIPFNWNVLEKYTLKKSFFLSGGIDLEQLKNNTQILKKNTLIYALDVNSKFEIEAGLKNIKKLKKFKDEIKISTN